MGNGLQLNGQSITLYNSSMCVIPNYDEIKSHSSSEFRITSPKTGKLSSLNVHIDTTTTKKDWKLFTLNSNMFIIPHRIKKLQFQPYSINTGYSIADIHKHKKSTSITSYAIISGNKYDKQTIKIICGYIRNCKLLSTTTTYTDLKNTKKKILLSIVCICIEYYSSTAP